MLQRHIILPRRRIFLALIVMLTCVGIPTFQSPAALADQASSLAKLTGLIVERLQLMPGVAMNKWNSRAAIEDAAREQSVIDHAARAAGGLGLDPVFAGRFMRAQIEAAKVMQSELLLQWSEEKHPPFPTPPDLALTIRPALDQLTPAMLSLLGSALSDLARNGMDDLLLVSANAPSSIKPALAVALAPLIEATRRKQ